MISVSSSQLYYKRNETDRQGKEKKKNRNNHSNTSIYIRVYLLRRRKNVDIMPEGIGEGKLYHLTIPGGTEVACK